MFSFIKKLLFGKKKPYLLIDAEHSCVFVPKRTYKMFDKMLEEGIENGRTDKSVRFLWSNNLMLHVCPDYNRVDKACTHGYLLDNNKKVLIPCPYIQQLLFALNLPYDYVGRVYLEKTTPLIGSMATYILTQNGLKV